MHKNTIISTAVAVASLAGTALAGSPAKIAATPCTPACQPAKECKLSGSLQAGYQSNYTYRGLVASHAAVQGDSVIPAALDLRYAVDPSLAVLGNVSYDTLLSGHKAFGEEGMNFENESNLTLAVEKKLCKYVKGLKVTGGYNLTHGGLEGFVAKHAVPRINWEEKNTSRAHAHSVTQEFFVNAEQVIWKKFYAGVTVNYSFQGATGWWYQPYVGYRTAICPCSDLDVTAGWTATSSYFNSDDVIGNANGSQAWFIKAAVDAKLSDKLSVVPFVSFNWLGCGAMKANKGVPEGEKPYQNFGVVAGASLVYKF